METIIKIDDENLEITKTEEPNVTILPKADIERNIANLEADLVRAKALLDNFK